MRSSTPPKSWPPTGRPWFACAWGPSASVCFPGHRATERPPGRHGVTSDLPRSPRRVTRDPRRGNARICMGTLSVNLSYGRPDPRLGSADLYDEMLEIAKCADRLGFHTVWLAQHHGVYALQLPSPLIAAAQLSQHVSCRIGTASLVLPYHH